MVVFPVPIGEKATKQKKYLPYTKHVAQIRTQLLKAHRLTSKSLHLHCFSRLQGMVDNLALFRSELQGAARFTRGQSALGSPEGSSTIWREGLSQGSTFQSLALISPIGQHSIHNYMYICTVP